MTTATATMHRARAAGMKPRTLLVAAVAVVLSGCAIQPKPMTDAEQRAWVKQDRASMFVNQTPIAGPLTLPEAMARAVSYNLDHRLKLMEEAVSQRQLDLANWSLLPRLTASAGYTTRDSVAASSSRDVRTGVQSLVPSTSQDKTRRTAELGTTWNILDFGVSYFQAQQQADRTLIMQERRRKVVHSLMQQVREAYWFALGAQRLEKKIEPLLVDVDRAMGNMQQIEVQRLSSPTSVLSQRRELIATMQQLTAVREELAQAKPRLAALINVAPGQAFSLAEPESMDAPPFDVDLAVVEEAALLHRPELIEARYAERIGVLETKIAMARLLPGIELGINRKYDSNSFLVDNQWNEAGLSVSWNLFNILSYPRNKATAEAMVEVARAQRMALSMAVLAQVHVAYRDYSGRKQQYQLARNLAEVDSKLYQQAKNAAMTNAQGQLTAISTGVDSLFSEFRLYQNYGALQNAYGLILATVGVDPLPQETTSNDIGNLTQSIGEVELRGIAFK